MTLLAILSDGFFAAVAAVGFGAVSDPPMRAFPAIALLAAVGHALRFCLMDTGVDIASASLCASVAIGIGSLLLGGRIHCPMTVLFIPALLPMIPSQEEFPYALRLVSEVISSNGSTSQASICGSTLALMDAGVPIKAPVAGISCGLITEGDRWMTMLDIQGVEDFHGDMDFKVGGTRKGITAIQMDIKIDGLTYDIIAEAFEKCRKGRLYILDEIIKPVIAEPRHELSRYAPKMFSMMIPTDKIKDVIGKGGKVIQDICATCNCKIDVQEDGHVFVSAVDQEDAKRAIFTIKTIVEDPEIGAIYKGKVTRLMNFGAFVEIAPGKEGLVHISKLDTKRVERVEDVVAVGDAIVVKVTDIDQQGRINLSRRDAILALEAKRAAQEQQ